VTRCQLTTRDLGQGARNAAAGVVGAGAAPEAERDITDEATRTTGGRRVTPSSRNSPTAPRQIPALPVTRPSSSLALWLGILRPLEAPELVMGGRPQATLPSLPRELATLVTTHLQPPDTTRVTLLTPETQVVSSLCSMSLCASTTIVFLLIMGGNQGFYGLVSKN